MLISPYRIDRGPGYKQPSQVPHGRAPMEIMLLLGLMKTREKERAGSVEGNCGRGKCGSGKCGRGDARSIALVP